ALGGSFGPADAWQGALQGALTAPELPGGGITAFPGRRMVAMYGSPGAPSLGVLGEQGIEQSLTRVPELVAEDGGPVEGPLVPAPELPGGGITAFPGRRMVAMYGSPGAPSLGVLGEQGIEQSLTRVQELVAEYEGLVEEPLVPALEIISTIASSEPGDDGDYSRALGVDTLREWVDAAGEAGVYVVLDLQPGTTDFLTQARLYEELLTAPHVGLALDSEWRLEPGQKHLEQIGS